MTTDFGGRSDSAGDVAIQADGKIVAAGSGFPAAVRPLDFALARYNRDGTLDSTFGDGGKVLTTFEPNSIDGANAVVIQPDGKIVAAGGTRSAGAPRADLAVARYLPNGSLDASFDGDGLVVTPISTGDDTVFDLAVQPDGKLIAAGWSSPGGFDIAMARYNPDGNLDSSFDGDGMVIAPFRPASTYASHVVVQRDGKILTGGTGLVRFNPDGGVDRSFGADGRAATDLGLVKPVLQPDGKILAAGSIQTSGQFSDFVVVRLTAAGRIDSTFGRGGRVVDGLPQAGRRDRRDPPGEREADRLGLHVASAVRGGGLRRRPLRGDPLLRRPERPAQDAQRRAVQPDEGAVQGRHGHAKVLSRREEGTCDLAATGLLARAYPSSRRCTSSSAADAKR